MHYCDTTHRRLQAEISELAAEASFESTVETYVGEDVGQEHPPHAPVCEHTHTNTHAPVDLKMFRRSKDHEITLQ